MNITNSIDTTKLESVYILMYIFSAIATGIGIFGTIIGTIIFIIRKFGIHTKIYKCIQDRNNKKKFLSDIISIIEEIPSDMIKYGPDIIDSIQTAITHVQDEINNRPKPAPTDMKELIQQISQEITLLNSSKKDMSQLRSLVDEINNSSVEITEQKV